MKRGILPIVLLLSISMVSALNLGSALDSFGGENLILISIFMISFILIQFILGRLPLFKDKLTDKPNKKITGFLGIFAGLLITYGVHTFNLNISGMFYNIGLSATTVENLMFAIIFIGTMLLLWKLKTFFIFLLGAFLIAVGMFTDWVYETTTVTMIGIFLIVLWVIVSWWISRKKKGQTVGLPGFPSAGTVGAVGKGLGKGLLGLGKGALKGGSKFMAWRKGKKECIKAVLKASEHARDQLTHAVQSGQDSANLRLTWKQLRTSLIDMAGNDKNCLKTAEREAVKLDLIYRRGRRGQVEDEREEERKRREEQEKEEKRYKAKIQLEREWAVDKTRFNKALRMENPKHADKMYKLLIKKYNPPAVPPTDIRILARETAEAIVREIHNMYESWKNKGGGGGGGGNLSQHQEQNIYFNGPGPGPNPPRPVPPPNPDDPSMNKKRRINDLKQKYGMYTFDIFNKPPVEIIKRLKLMRWIILEAKKLGVAPKVFLSKKIMGYQYEIPGEYGRQVIAKKFKPKFDKLTKQLFDLQKQLDAAPDEKTYNRIKKKFDAVAARLSEVKEGIDRIAKESQRG